MAESSPSFERLTRVDRALNAAIRTLVGLGIGPGHMRVLEVRGRKTGKLHATPIDVLVVQDRLYLVAPRGRTQWVRNAEASGEVTLRRGARADGYQLRALSDAEKPEILKAYLDRFRHAVQRFFTVPAGSPPAAFAAIAGRYPTFELIPKA